MPTPASVICAAWREQPAPQRSCGTSGKATGGNPLPGLITACNHLKEQHTMTDQIVTPAYPVVSFEDGRYWLDLSDMDDVHELPADYIARLVAGDPSTVVTSWLAGEPGNMMEVHPGIPGARAFHMLDPHEDADLIPVDDLAGVLAAIRAVAWV